MDNLIDLLEASIEKNGDKPLTLSHLLNMLKLLKRLEDREYDDHAEDYHSIY